MTVWRERFPGRPVDVDHEDLVQSNDDTLRGVLEYAGLSWQDHCLDFAMSKTAVTTASAAQIREKPHTRSIGRWRHQERPLQAMKKVLTDGQVV